MTAISLKKVLKITIKIISKSSVLLQGKKDLEIHLGA